MKPEKACLWTSVSEAALGQGVLQARGRLMGVQGTIKAPSEKECPNPESCLGQGSQQAAL